MSRPVDAENLVPRKYQEEVFEKAKQGNIIAALNTGSGKTLISLLLIKWTTAQQEMKDKKVIFLVPKVTLVEQQGDFIADNTPLRVAKLHGSLDLNMMDRSAWVAKFESNDVFVMTAQICLNLVTHSIWTIDKVSLLIFDECHHTRKNHPYNSIMREYLQVPADKRPKIFGMTASPVWNPKDAQTSLATLEKNLDAKVIGVREHLEELAENSPKPIEIIKQYPPPLEGANFPSPSIHKVFGIFDTTVWDLLNVPWYNIEMRYYATLSNLGPYPAALFLYTEIRTHISRLGAGPEPGVIDVIDMDLDVQDLPLPFLAAEPPVKPSYPEELETIREIIDGYAPWFPTPGAPMITPIPLTLEWCTPKIGVLVDLLHSFIGRPTPAVDVTVPESPAQNKAKGFQGIVFVEQRQVAALLSLVLSNLPEFEGKIKTAHLVGAGLSKEGSIYTTGLTGEPDKEVVRKFRNRELNLLIATSVAEEGLDFPACDLVVRFDPLQHMVGYVQSRGRARNKASTFVVMIRQDDEAHLTRYSMLKDGEPLMDQVVKAPDRREVENARQERMDDDDDDADPQDVLQRERYVVPNTGAVLTYDNALHLLHLVCSLIPHDAFTPSPKPVFSISMLKTATSQPSPAVSHPPTSVPVYYQQPPARANYDPYAHCCPPPSSCGQPPGPASHYCPPPTTYGQPPSPASHYYPPSTSYGQPPSPVSPIHARSPVSPTMPRNHEPAPMSHPYAHAVRPHPYVYPSQPSYSSYAQPYVGHPSQNGSDLSYASRLSYNAPRSSYAPTAYPQQPSYTHPYGYPSSSQTAASYAPQPQHHSPYNSHPSSRTNSTSSASSYPLPPLTTEKTAANAYQFTLRLPAGLPLDKGDRIFVGPVRRSKREAKRAAAFLAVRRLRDREILDEFLLPAGAASQQLSIFRPAPKKENLRGMGPGVSYPDPAHDRMMGAWLYDKLSKTGNIVKASVVDPWVVAQSEEDGRLWLHDVEVRERSADGARPSAGRLVTKLGLVSGTALPLDVQMTKDEHFVKTTQIRQLTFTCGEDQADATRAMAEFTRAMIWYRITGSPISLPLGAYIVPLGLNGLPDFVTIANLLRNPFGSTNWTALPLEEVAAGNVLVVNANERGRMMLLRHVRDDLTPLSKPPPGSREEAFPTYYEYWVNQWSRKKRVAIVSEDGPLLEGAFVPRMNYGLYPAWDEHNAPFAKADTVANGTTYPQNSSSWIILPSNFLLTLHLLSPFFFLLADVYRARRARHALALPPITDELMIEALMLPSVNAGFSNQRLETLGDAVLELCTTVYLFERWKFRHEGQLSTMRRSVVANWFLLRRGLEVGLDEFIGAERRNEGKGRWRFVVGGNEQEEGVSVPAGGKGKEREREREKEGDGGNENGKAGVKMRRANVSYPKRSLQDCMEALLGAAFLSGGIPMALRAGTAIGMAFGGIEPWERRYGEQYKPKGDTAPLFQGLQETLGYNFRNNDILLEAITHPSFAASDGKSYQRLEFLGDAILDLVVVKYLYDKFPNATSEQLAFPRTKAVCASALACLAVRKLGLHKIMLANSFDLSGEIQRYVPLLAATTGEEIVRRGWRYDPPKALSDVFESIIGAVLVDSGYDYERTAAVTEMVMEEVLEALSPQLKKDPVSELTEWVAINGCRDIKFEKREVEKVTAKGAGIAVVLHGITVSGPILSTSLNIARFVAAERALGTLQNTEHPKALKKICICGKAMDIDEVYREDDDGYYQLGSMLLPSLTAAGVLAYGDGYDDDAEAEEVAEVERMLIALDE